MALVIGGHRARLIRETFALFKSARLFLGHFTAQSVLRNYTVLVESVINGFRRAHAMGIRVPALLLLVHVLAQARLLFRRELLVLLTCSHSSSAYNVGGGALRLVLLGPMHRDPSG